MELEVEVGRSWKWKEEMENGGVEDGLNSLQRALHQIYQSLSFRKRHYSPQSRLVTAEHVTNLASKFVYIWKKILSERVINLARVLARLYLSKLAFDNTIPPI